MRLMKLVPSGSVFLEEAATTPNTISYSTILIFLLPFSQLISEAVSSLSLTPELGSKGFSSYRLTGREPILAVHARMGPFSTPLFFGGCPRFGVLNLGLGVAVPFHSAPDSNASHFLAQRHVLRQKSISHSRSN